MDATSSVNEPIANQEDIKERLDGTIKGKVVILGIGNDLRGDDGFGSILVKGLKGRVRGTVFDGGRAPENYIGKIIREKPDTILIVDALDMGGKPGEMVVWEPKRLRKGEFSTHHLSLSLLASMIQSETGAKLFIIGVQPARIKLGEGLSPPVERALEKLKATLEEILA